MSNAKKSNTSSKSKNTDTVEVLYQRMGEKWFAFSLIEDEVFVGSLTPEEIHGEAAKVQKVFKVSGKA